MRFPKYGEFWQKFVGVRQIHGMLLPYGLRMPHQMAESDRKTIGLLYEELCMAHFTLFCHLAGAHFQLGILRSSLPTNGNPQRHFDHWEAFEVCYLHIGIALNQIHHLWGLVFLMQGVMHRDSKRRIVGLDSTGKQVGVERMLKDVLSSIHKVKLARRIEDLEANAGVLRNSVTHFSRGASLQAGGMYYIPFKIRSNVVWTHQLRARNYVETSAKTASDLTRVEETINSLHVVLIERLESYLNQTGIAIDQS